MTVLRLSLSTFWVDVRLAEMYGRWIASADTPDGPSLGLGLGAVEAIEAALEPFKGLVDELLASLGDSPLTWPETLPSFVRICGRSDLTAPNRPAADWLEAVVREERW